SSFLLLSFSIILPYLIVDLKLCNRTEKSMSDLYQFDYDSMTKRETIEQLEKKLEEYNNFLENYNNDSK
ncbi:hypothetical protein, partial [Enterococcus faecium]|uniref:hypothetical protein n=1 Tax=Enterococcus faecium TaxID=1352 RepID=UPI0025438EF8